MAGTVATIYAIGQRNTVLFYPYGVTDACGRFFGNGYRTDGSCGTDFAASGTFRTAIATLIGHFGLHQSRQVGGGAEHSVANPAILFYIVEFCLVRSVEGRSTPLGHTDTQSWQAVQCRAKSRALKAPGGTIGVARLGTFLSSMTASPPSTFFSCAWIADVTASTAVADRKLRREAPSTPPDGELGVSILEASPSGEVWRGLRGLRGLRLMAPCRHVSMQSMHATQRL